MIDTDESLFETPRTGPGRIVTECLCDDVNGDGSVLTSYTVAYELTIRCGRVERCEAGTYTDETFTTPYVPVNPVACETIGDPAPYEGTYTDSNPVCVRVNGAGPVAALQLIVRDSCTHLRVATLYEDPTTGTQFDPTQIELVDAQECC